MRKDESLSREALLLSATVIHCLKQEKHKRKITLEILLTVIRTPNKFTS